MGNIPQTRASFANGGYTLVANGDPTIGHELADIKMIDNANRLCYYTNGVMTQEQQAAFSTSSCGVLEVFLTKNCTDAMIANLPDVPAVHFIGNGTINLSGNWLHKVKSITTEDRPRLIFPESNADKPVIIDKLEYISSYSVAFNGCEFLSLKTIDCIENMSGFPRALADDKDSKVIVMFDSNGRFEFDDNDCLYIGVPGHVSKVQIMRGLGCVRHLQLYNYVSPWELPSGARYGVIDAYSEYYTPSLLKEFKYFAGKVLWRSSVVPAESTSTE